MNFRDISDSPVIYNYYGGANGKKKTVFYDGKYHMLKENVHLIDGRRIIRDYDGKKVSTSYINSIYSEYVASQVINYLNFHNIKSHKTELVKINNKKYIACEDLCLNSDQNLKLISMASILQEGDENKQVSDLNTILKFINTQNYVANNIMLSFFWDQFILDALLGNYDRHLGNWSLIYNHNNMEYKISPIYDNGSSLISKTNDDIINKAISSPNNGFFKGRILDSWSNLTINGKNIKYREFLANTDDLNVIKSLVDFYNIFDLQKVIKFIDTLNIDKNLQEFYKRYIITSNEYIIKYAYENNPNIIKKSSDK